MLYKPTKLIYYVDVYIMLNPRQTCFDYLTLEDTVIEDYLRDSKENVILTDSDVRVIGCGSLSQLHHTVNDLEQHFYPCQMGRVGTADVTRHYVLIHVQSLEYYVPIGELEAVLQHPEAWNFLTFDYTNQPPECLISVINYHQLPGFSYVSALHCQEGSDRRFATIISHRVDGFEPREYHSRTLEEDRSNADYVMGNLYQTVHFLENIFHTRNPEYQLGSLLCLRGNIEPITDLITSLLTSEDLQDHTMMRVYLEMIVDHRLEKFSFEALIVILRLLTEKLSDELVSVLASYFNQQFDVRSCLIQYLTERIGVSADALLRLTPNVTAHIIDLFGHFPEMVDIWGLTMSADQHLEWIYAYATHMDSFSTNVQRDLQALINTPRSPPVEARRNRQRPRDVSPIPMRFEEEPQQP
jgi:hypothetical protein